MISRCYRKLRSRIPEEENRNLLSSRLSLRRQARAAMMPDRSKRWEAET